MFACDSSLEKVDTLQGKVVFLFLIGKNSLLIIRLNCHSKLLGNMQAFYLIQDRTGPELSIWE